MYSMYKIYTKEHNIRDKQLLTSSLLLKLFFRSFQNFLLFGLSNSFRKKFSRHDLVSLISLGLIVLSFILAKLLQLFDCSVANWSFPNLKTEEMLNVKKLIDTFDRSNKGGKNRKSKTPRFFFAPNFMLSSVSDITI